MQLRRLRRTQCTTTARGDVSCCVRRSPPVSACTDRRGLSTTVSHKLLLEFGNPHMARTQCLVRPQAQARRHRERELPAPPAPPRPLKGISSGLAFVAQFRSHPDQHPDLSSPRRLAFLDHRPNPQDPQNHHWPEVAVVWLMVLQPSNGSWPIRDQPPKRADLVGI